MLRALIAVFLTALMLIASPVAAQDTAINYEEWETVASKAEDQLSEPEVPNETLAQTRQQVVEWRARFDQAQDANSGRISTVNQQLAALGDPPAEGESEDEEVANRRAVLEKQLAELQAPRLSAVEAFSRADAIIKQMDEATARRQATALARVSPSPLLPSSWLAAGEDTLQLAEGLWLEGEDRSTDQTIWQQLKPQLPKVLAYLAAAIVLLTYGRWWVDTLPSRLSARASEHSRAVVVFVTSLGQIAIPMIGLYLLISAITASDLPGPYSRPFWDALPIAGVILFSGLWLTRQLFPAKAINYDTLTMQPKPRNTARRMTVMLSLVFAVHSLLSQALLQGSGLYERVEDSQNRVPMVVSDAGSGVIHYVLVLLAGFALFRLGKALRSLRRVDSGEAQTYRHTILSVVGTLTRILVIASVIIGAMGFVTFANVLIWPWSLTLALIALLILLQDFIADLFDMLKRGQEGARDGLAPLLIGFSLILLSIPLFLVIWGARRTDLAEMWNNFRQGISLGGITLSPGSVLTFFVLFAIGYSITRGIQGAFRSSILPKTRLDAGGQNAVVSGIGYVGIVIAALIAITSAGIDLSSLAIVAGALSVGIGFGLQNIVSNFVSGIILLIERPVSVGDWISAGGQQGIVKRISVRSTQVETFDKTEVIVPNSDLISQPVTNWTRHNQTGRIIIPVGVAYGSDTRRVQEILMEIIEDQPLVTIDPAPAVLFRAFGADSLEFEIRAVLSDVGAGLGVTSEVCHQIAERFKAEGLEIPFAQRDIWLRNPETLRGDGARQDREEQPKPIAQTRQDAPRPDPRIAFDDADDGADMPDAGGDGDGR